MSKDLKIIVGMIAIALVAIILMLKFNSCNSGKLEDNHSNKVSLQNDSLLNDLSVKIIEKVELRILRSDSALIYAKGYHVADSINKRYWKNKINQIPKYSPGQRNSIYDSIYGKTQ